MYVPQTVTGVTVVGVRGHLVAVEAHVGRGLPSLTLTGLPGAGVQDARDRIRPAVEGSSSLLPPSMAAARRDRRTTLAGRWSANGGGAGLQLPARSLTTILGVTPSWLKRPGEV